MRLETERLLLRGAKAESDQIIKEVGWLNDPEVVRYSEQRHRKHSYGSQSEYILGFHWPNMLMEIYEKTANRLIGTCSVITDMPNSCSDLGLLIGERDCWGKGYGLEAWCAMLKYIFVMTPVRMITGGCMEENVAMHKIMLKSGMQPMGYTSRRFVFEGRRVDAIYFGVER